MPATAVYATIAQVRSFGVDVSAAPDAMVTDALATASRWVDDRTDQRRFGFGAPVVGASVTVRNAVGPVVALPAPLSAITAVTVNGVAQTDLTAWAVEGGDSRLLVFAPNGFEQRIPTMFQGSSWGLAPVLVPTGTWGYPDVPGLVSKATWLYATYQLVTDPTFQQATSERMGAYATSTGANAVSLADLAMDALRDGGLFTAVLA